MVPGPRASLDTLPRGINHIAAEEEVEKEEEVDTRGEGRGGGFNL